MKSKTFRNLSWITILIVLLTILFISLNKNIVYAEGLVDEAINSDHLYSMYSLKNYQLDFYVDNSWGWLPWNWSDGIGKSVQYGLYCITNFLWIIILYLSNATGYVVQEAYKLDFINDMADAIGKSIQTIAGVNQNGFSNTGFYIGFLLLIILIVGVYVAYTGLIKKETSKAISAVVNFIVVFVVSASFIAYAPEYIKKVNEFSSDISTAALTLGTDIVIPNSNSEGKDSIDLIRDNLFSIQVKQPWLLLQYGNSDIEEIGEERVETLLSTNPDEEDGKAREEIVKMEIEERGNNNLTITEVVNRLGMVLFLLIFNLGISIFVFLLASMMIFSQILFIIFAIFLPISFLLSMIPSYESIAKRAIVKLFNTIMMRSGITLIITVAFSISTMFYTISTGYPFFMIAFLQIVTFAGIYLKLGDIMGMFSLQSGDSQSIGRYIFRKPYRTMRNKTRKLERSIKESLGDKVGFRKNNPQEKSINPQRKHNNSKSKLNHNRDNIKPSIGERIGNTAGSVMDTKKRIEDKSRQFRDSIQGVPTQAQYTVYNAKEKVKENISDFKRGIIEERESRQNERDINIKSNRQSIAEKRSKLDNIGALKNKGGQEEKLNNESIAKHKKSKNKWQEDNRNTISNESVNNIGNKNINQKNSNKNRAVVSNKINSQEDISNRYIDIKDNNPHKTIPKDRITTNITDQNTNQYNSEYFSNNENSKDKVKKEQINKNSDSNRHINNYRSESRNQSANKNTKNSKSRVRKQ